MKIFISYSRRDSGDFAKQIYESLKDEHNVFTDINKIQVGDIWSNEIEDNITTCDIFIVIVTFQALRSSEVEREVLLAKKKNKTIIPCFYTGINKNQIKWDLEKHQGIEFDTKYELARDVYSKIQQYQPKLERNSKEESKQEQVQRRLPPAGLKTKVLEVTVALGIVIGGILGIYAAYMHQQQQQSEPTRPCESQICFDSSWGSEGTAEGQFNNISGIAVDNSGNILVADGSNNRIQKFTSDGKYISEWGAPGRGQGQFSFPLDVTVDASSSVLILDDRVQYFTSDGKYIKEWASFGEGKGQFGFPTAIATDSSGYVYVTDSFNNNTHKFTSDGKYIKEWGSYGKGKGQFRSPHGVAVDTSNDVYVVDSGNNRIAKFTSDGKYIKEWGSYGKGKGQFDNPVEITADSSDNIYVVDRDNNRIEKFNSDGKYISEWGSYGSGKGQFDTPEDVAVDTSGNVYVADRGNERIQKFVTNNP